MLDIPTREEIINILQINKGLSKDKKYYAETTRGEKLLLRFSDISFYSKKEAIYMIMKKMDALGVPMSRPVEFGVCNDQKSVYTMTTWCEGQEMEKLISNFSETEQYCLGVKVGKILKKIHSVPAPQLNGNWLERYDKVNKTRIDAYKNCGIHTEGSEAILAFLEEHKHLLNGRPQCYHHGDFHMGNILMDHNQSLAVIDWDIVDYDNLGDPWQEFYCIGNIAATNPYFAAGQIDGYFDKNIPIDFWYILTIYLAGGAITAIPWAKHFGQDMINEILELCRNVSDWYDNMKNPIPKWYSLVKNKQIV